jgi:class 3 adenylate cyclase/tetratricopeptide (TPR) repeat protein
VRVLSVSRKEIGGVTELRRWLAEAGLEELADALHAHDLDLDVLPDLTDADLREIGLTLGQRKRLLKAVATRVASAERAPVRTAPGGERAPGEAELRQMTIMFCDMVGSTQLSQRFDAEDMFAIIASYQRCCTEVIQRFGGHVARYLGDGVLAYFGFPAAREDDAERAVRAGLELIGALRRLRPRGDLVLQVRVGVDTGLVVIGDLLTSGIGEEETVVGETANRAARLQTLAPPDGLVIGPNTHRLLGELFDCKELGAHELKGFPEPLPVWRVVGEGRAEGRFEARAAGTLSPLIGREHELRLIQQRWELARSGEGQVLLLSGEAGIGKSRLLDALSREIMREPHRRLRHFCSQFYADTALYPVIERVRRGAGLSRDDPPEIQLAKLDAMLEEIGEDPRRSGALLATLCSVPLGERYPSATTTPGERKNATLDLLVRMIQALARREPLLVVFEDAHWMDPTTAELVALLIDAVAALPVLLVVTFRPEFPAPWQMRAHVTALQLNRFGRRQAVALIERLAAPYRLPGEVVEVILAKTDGVPLFVEELTRALLESGSLIARGDRYELSGPLPLIAIPSSLHDSLMARLDRLAAVKEVALWASVLGRSFTPELLAAVSPLRRVQVDEALARLVEAELVYRHGTGNDQVYEFRHALVQEAAYSSMLRVRRQQMHAAVAQALETSFPELAAQRPEVLAHHFLEAGVADKAAAYLLAAGDAAASRYASPEAHARFARAAELARQLPAGPRAQRTELKAILKCASVAFGAAQIEADLAALERAQALAVALDHRPRLAQVHYWRGRLHYVAGRFAEAVGEGRTCLAIADEVSDERIAAAAVNLLARIHCLRGEPAHGIAYAQRNTEQMAQIGDRIEQAAITGVLAFALGLAARFGEAHEAASRAVALADELGHLPTRAACHFFRGVAHGWQGDLALAEPCFAQALELAAAGRDTFRRYLTLGWRGEARLRAGRLGEAAADLGAALELSEAIGSAFHRGGFGALLAEAMLQQGDLETALRLSESAVAEAERGDAAWGLSQALRARAEALAAAGEAGRAPAVELLRRAILIQGEQELAYDSAWSRLALGRLLLLMGEPRGEAELAAAADMFAAAGMTHGIAAVAATRERRAA